MTAVLKIQSLVLYEIQTFFRARGFTELPPVITAPITDPLAHGVHPAYLDYEGQTLQLTKSMIFHKQIALLGDINKIFIISPNVRLEKSREAKDRHLLEFQQIDFEMKGAKKADVYLLMEDLLTKIIATVKAKCKAELVILGRKLPTPKTPFPRFSTTTLIKQYGENYESELSKAMTTPFWIESLYREFYDKEDPTTRGHFINYDLIYPEGFEEGLSGGEREHDYEVIIRKMKERRMDTADYEIYLELAKEKLIPQTAGAGFGLQRLLRYLTGIKKMEEVVLFPRSPREKILF
ncbi:MAG: hypothetical protein ACD_72C00118G0001 [uncultured bacterium]|nr:MAG: hypothetical protein ACD_72C00118G0001 [uncultured bacterium]